MYDTIIRGGKLFDGTGGAPFTADIAITGGRIAAIGQLSEPAREEIDASGAIVTPGFIDVHTHYDGQFVWDDTLDPSFSHGVTTAIGGNCGVGFAPVRQEFRKPLMELMEGVEEIPGIVLDEGLDWKWQSFPEYLDRLDSQSYSMDIACHLTHAPLRVFVMGQRALDHEDATPEDIAEMARLTREAMDAGAIGFSAGRILEHMSITGAHVPGTFADDAELIAIAEAMGSSGHGVFQIIPMGALGNFKSMGTDREGRRAEHRRMERLAEVANRPLTYLAVEFADDVDDRPAIVAQSDEAVAGGVRIHPQIAARGAGALLLLDGHHPFVLKPAYQEIAHLPLAERAEAMRDPARRAAILSQEHGEPVGTADVNYVPMIKRLGEGAGRQYLLSEPADYEPGPEKLVASLAAAAGVPPLEFVYDHLAAGDGGNGLISYALGYSSGNLDQTYELLANPNVISGLGDGGAHVKLICDASMPTFQMTFWARDRQRGPTLPLEYVVRKMTSDPAGLYGLADRGTLAVGQRADINVIDYDRLAIGRPQIAHDLPQGGARVLQDSVGYLATLVGGVVTRRNDADTGARPGRLVRSKPVPA